MSTARSRISRFLTHYCVKMNGYGLEALVRGFSRSYARNNLCICSCILFSISALFFDLAPAQEGGACFNRGAPWSSDFLKKLSFFLMFISNVENYLTINFQSFFKIFLDFFLFL